MKKYIKLICLFFLFGCSINQEVFWCGDHACVNKKEKEKYFAKNMIVEIKDIKNNDDIENSKFNQIIKQAESLSKNDKKYINLTKRQKKQKIKEEKKLAKLIQKQEQKRIKEEKKIERKIKKDELLRIKNEKKNIKEIKKEEKIVVKTKINSKKKITNKKNTLTKKNKIKDSDNKKSSNFMDIVKIIQKTSSVKSFPDINKNLE